MTPAARILIDYSVRSTNAAARAVAHYRPLVGDARVLLEGHDEATFRGVLLIVLGVRLADDTPVEVVARRLRELQPHIGIFVVATKGECAPSRLAGLAHAGVDELYLVDAPEECERFADHVRRRLEVPPPEEALRRVGGGGAARHRIGWVTMWLLRNSHRNPSIDDAAAHFGRHRTTVWRWFRDAGLPDPGTILRCGRVLHVKQLLEGGILDSQKVADLLGMESVAGVWMILHRARRDEELATAFQRLGLRDGDD